MDRLAELGRARWLMRSLPLIGVGSVLIIIVVLYFGYDVMSARASPCETIFRQTTLRLSTKIGFLKTRGEVQIGREPLTELTERAQMTALGLKTCCTVLEAGRLNPEEFLQCKSSARAYEARIDNIVSTVEQVAEARSGAENRSTIVASSGSAATSGADGGSADGAAPSVPVAREEIMRQLEAARAVSKKFNNQVDEVRKTQVLQSLEVQKPSHVDVTATEREPNNDTLNTNVIEIGQWVTAAISEASDRDVYSFTTPETYRDWIKIELDNRSTTLEPRITLFDSDKTNLGNRYNTTAGANHSYSFVSAPGMRYSFQINNYYGKSTGAYLVRVVATKAYDNHEPNDGILDASPAKPGEPTSGEIMDKHDVDFFRFELGGAAKTMEVKLSNRSTTLRPRVMVFDDNKSEVANRYNTTGGGDLGFSHDVTAGSTYYLRVSDYYSDAGGAYDLTVTLKP